MGRDSPAATIFVRDFDTREFALEGLLAGREWSPCRLMPRDNGLDVNDDAAKEWC